MSRWDEPFWMELRASAENRVRAEGGEGVRLAGGPMDGWFVKEDAAVLSQEWYETWPTSIQVQNQPGRYVLSDDGTSAKWELLAR
jgi:hypothetical protein